MVRPKTQSESASAQRALLLPGLAGDSTRNRPRVPRQNASDSLEEIRSRRRATGRRTAQHAGGKS